MFTGIVEEIGYIKKIKNNGVSAEFTIEGHKIFSDLKLGDSVAVNGVCLTVTSYGNQIFTADIMHETLRRSSLNQVAAGCYVNLERAMTADGRFGGHIVSGHIDGTGNILSIINDGNAVWFTIQVKENLSKYIVEKGSIAIDGISLTVATIENDVFSVSIIPHTLKETALGYKKNGDLVNIENDIIGKYVDKLIGYNKNNKYKKSKITEEFLIKNGF